MEFWILGDMITGAQATSQPTGLPGVPPRDRHNQPGPLEVEFPDGSGVINIDPIGQYLPEILKTGQLGTEGRMGNISRVF